MIRPLSAGTFRVSKGGAETVRHKGFLLSRKAGFQWPKPAGYLVDTGNGLGKQRAKLPSEPVMDGYPNQVIGKRSEVPDES
mgnify:CR=1 FL=1